MNRSKKGIRNKTVRHKNKSDQLKTKPKNNVKTIKNKDVYTNSDFNSGDGMITSSWGPAFWHILHMMSFNYPVNPTKENKEYYKLFVLNLKNVLPCKYCRINLKNNFKVLPLTDSCMENRETFSKYIYNLHETVNKMLGKKSGLTYEDVRIRYENFRARCTIESPKIFNFRKLKTLKREKGCTEPLYGKKSKCIIKIVPQESSDKSFQMDKQCIKYRG
jgi:hypothetical protein